MGRRHRRAGHGRPRDAVAVQTWQWLGGAGPAGRSAGRLCAQVAVDAGRPAPPPPVPPGHQRPCVRAPQQPARAAAARRQGPVSLLGSRRHPALPALLEDLCSVIDLDARSFAPACAALLAVASLGPEHLALIVRWLNWAADALDDHKSMRTRRFATTATPRATVDSVPRGLPVCGHKVYTFWRSPLLTSLNHASRKTLHPRG